MKKLCHQLLFVLALLTLVTFAACSDDDPATPELEDPLPPIEPPTQDILMSNLKQIYEGMLTEEYESMLSPDFRTVILQSTFDAMEDSDNPLTTLYFDHEHTVGIHGNLFGNVEGEDEHGYVVSPIESISVSILEKEGAWQEADDSIEYFGGRGAYYARYNLLMHFNKPNGSRFEVDQTIDFFAIQGDDDSWRLLGTRGFENKSYSKLASENMPFDKVMALYR